MNSKGEILKTVQANLFHAIAMNVDQNHYKMCIQIIHMTNGKSQSLFILTAWKRSFTEDMGLKQHEGE